MTLSWTPKGIPSSGCAPVTPYSRPSRFTGFTFTFFRLTCRGSSRTETKVCYVNSARFDPAATRFILSNYILFDRPATNLAVAGKELGHPSGDGTYSFEVAIPATYAVVSESGITAGELDGAPYAGPVRLEPGPHRFHRTSGWGKAAIFSRPRSGEGFHPRFNYDSE